MTVCRGDGPRFRVFVELNVSALHLVDDSVGDARQHIVGHVVPIRRHEVRGGHSPQNAHVPRSTGMTNYLLHEFNSILVNKKKEAKSVASLRVSLREALGVHSTKSSWPLSLSLSISVFQKKYLAQRSPPHMSICPYMYL